MQQPDGSLGGIEEPSKPVSQSVNVDASAAATSRSPAPMAAPIFRGSLRAASEA